MNLTNALHPIEELLRQVIAVAPRIAIAAVIRDEEGEHVIPCSRLAEETVHLERAKKPRD